MTPCRWTIAFVVLAVAACSALGAIPGAPESHRRPMESHHSFHHPFDQSSVYWKYGGHTVMTSRAIRLTPATQSRMGWLWNDYPLESTDWEVEIGVRVYSKPHFGGDGFAFWVLSAEMDPAYHTDTKHLSGPVFGLKDEFKGFGVVFDTYDNDGRRDNPSVFVVKNEEGKFRFNHNNDFADDYIRDTPDNLPYKCTADYRNLGKPIKVLFRYNHGVLHVYIDDTVKERGYKFCLAVNVDLGSKITERHLAFTSMTGEVADAIELTQITTHYLDDRDADIADASLEYSQSVGSSRLRWLYWLIVFFIGLSLVIWTFRDIIQLSSMQKNHTNPVYICNELNQWMLPHFYLHFALCCMLVIAGNILLLLLNLPLALYRLYMMWTKNHILDPAILSGGNHKGHAKPKLSYTTRLYMAAASYLISLIFYCINLFG